MRAKRLLPCAIPARVLH